MLFHKKSFLSLFLLATIAAPLCAEVKAKKKKDSKVDPIQVKITSPFYAVAQEYMKGYARPELDEEDEKSAKKLRLAIPEIPAYIKYSKIYSLYGTVPVTNSSIFNKNSWDDLEVLKGEHEESINLVTFLDKTHSSFGRLYLTYLLATPISDTTKLKNRQAVIKECTANPKLTKVITTSLESIKRAENNFLFLWQEETDYNFKAINSYFFTSQALPGSSYLRKGNTNPHFMELLCLKGRLISAGIALSIPTIHYLINRLFLTQIETEKAQDAYKKDKRSDLLAQKLDAAALFEDGEVIACDEQGNRKSNSNGWGWEYKKERVLKRNSRYELATKTMDQMQKLSYVERFSFNSSGGNGSLRSIETPKDLAAFAASYPTLAAPVLAEICGKDIEQLILKDALYVASLSHASSKALRATINQHIPLNNMIQPGSTPGTFRDPENPAKDISRSDFWDKTAREKITWGDAHTDMKIAAETSGSDSGDLKALYMLTGVVGGLEALTMGFAYSREDAYNKLTNYLHIQMMAVSNVIRALETISYEIEKNPVLFDRLEHGKQILALFDEENETVSDKLHQLVQLLLTNTFTGEPGYLTLKGRVLAAYALMKNIKEQLAPALMAVGELDALLSCATLYQEFANGDNHYAFATYLQQDTPYLSMENMWNPFLPVRKAVPNSIELGGKNPKNVILTGPNAGGKSTFSKGLTLNVVLAQTIGIVPAQSLKLTVFDKINTYMNITDDTAAGNSLFKSEVLRAQELLNTITHLPKNQFSFSVMDEMFSGTSPKEGEAASYAVAKNIGSHKHSIAVIATHFPRLKGLEKDTTDFKNYQVRIIRHEDSSFSYPFKLEEGAADQNVAIDILQQQGFGSSILADAHAILNEQPQQPTVVEPTIAATE